MVVVGAEVVAGAAVVFGVSLTIGGVVIEGATVSTVGISALIPLSEVPLPLEGTTSTTVVVVLGTVVVVLATVVVVLGTVVVASGSVVVVVVVAGGRVVLQHVEMQVLRATGSAVVLGDGLHAIVLTRRCRQIESHG